MKKLIAFLGIVTIGLWSITSSSNILATDFSDESAWQNKCKYPQSTSEDAQLCAEFQEYLSKQSEDLQSRIDSLDNNLASIKSDITKIGDAVKEQQELIDSITKKIEINEATIRTINEEITKLDISISETQESIDKRDKLIKDRMRNEQETLGTNMSLEVIMGANDLVDMIRKLDGLQRITDSDQQEIDKFKQEKADLDLQKNEQTRLKADAETKKAENESDKSSAESIKAQKEELLTEYRQKEADYLAEQQAAEADLNSLRSNISNINTSVEGNYSYGSNSGVLSKPINGGVVSGAGTWHYGGGGVHLGADVGVSIGTTIVAPSNGVVLYVANGYPINGGYLGNMVGWPYGAGNDLLMVTQVEGVTYAISFAHMSNSVVSPGASVSQGQVIGYTGNSGNSSGPHCHVEVINLGSMSVGSAVSYFQGSADFSFGTGWGSAALSNTCSVSGPPCRERSEEIFGY